MGMKQWMQNAKDNRLQPPEGFITRYIKTFDGADLRMGYAGQASATKGTVVFLPGRTEFIEKFYEDMHLWHKLGFAVAGLDLRGQGLSYREDPDRDKHYLSSFDPHIKDVKAVLEALSAAGMPKPFTLMAHSAGSHVTLRFLHDHGSMVARAVTISPMVRIARGGLPDWLFRGLPALMVKLGWGHSYVPGHTAFKTGRWGWRKKLTHDDERFKDEDHFIFNQDRNLAVGGATYRWIVEALASTDTLNAAGYAEAINTPVLMLQAAEDEIVDNEAMTNFAARLPHCDFQVIANAKHEMLKETDAVRSEIWSYILPFMELDVEMGV
ncbi:lysophospholipase L2 [Kordiimonas sediminis]|uniref:Lysophospholipase L2 n=1 Tax=Kordiimonas sediminis TaxID=1735581 RepID=A0A919AJP6_9PROT|nr:alpha/beta hydrolase [Kordiimonas sediminis]GHF11238.1 lysophospholipase L2 [Kordiimonas sediminis]